MKTTKSQLRQIIKEELEVILTNEEAGELFGEARLGYEGIASALSKDPMARKDKNFLMNFIQNELEGYKKFDK